MQLSQSELSALQLIFTFIQPKEVITKAMDTYSNDESELSQDKADLCYKAIKAFLED